jgi:hypothetical protein
VYTILAGVSVAIILGCVCVQVVLIVMRRNLQRLLQELRKPRIWTGDLEGLVWESWPDDAASYVISDLNIMAFEQDTPIQTIDTPKNWIVL